MAVSKTPVADPAPIADPPEDDPRLAQCLTELETTRNSLSATLERLEALEKRDPESPKIAVLETQLAELRQLMVKTRQQAATLGKASRTSPRSSKSAVGPDPAPVDPPAPKRGRTATGHDFI